jgi:hypothetical protein
MDKHIMDFNVSFYDKVNRLVMGSLLLIAMMSMESIPAWLTLVPLYPILTAIAAWDPLYAVFNLARKTVAEKSAFKGGKLALGS